MPWIAFSLGLAIGAFVGVLAIGLVSMTHCQEYRESKGDAYDMTQSPNHIDYRGSGRTGR